MGSILHHRDLEYFAATIIPLPTRSKVHPSAPSASRFVVDVVLPLRVSSPGGNYLVVKFFTEQGADANAARYVVLFRLFFVIIICSTGPLIFASRCFVLV